jgi:hypothetical protein
MRQDRQLCQIIFELRNQYLHTCEKMLTQLMQMMIEISELVDNSSSYPNFSNIIPLITSFMFNEYVIHYTQSCTGI